MTLAAKSGFRNFDVRSVSKMTIGSVEPMRLSSSIAIVAAE
jgi:hypothetical protein